MAKNRRRQENTKGAFVPAVNVKRIVSLNGGKHAYVLDFKGKTHHVAVASDEMLGIVREMKEVNPDRISQELKSLQEVFPEAKWGKLDLDTADSLKDEG